jgi:hypothetical protein
MFIGNNSFCDGDVIVLGSSRVPHNRENNDQDPEFSRRISRLSVRFLLLLRIENRF